MILEQLPTGGDRNFGYIIGDPETRTGAVIDPSYAPGRVHEQATALDLTIRYVLNTHGHHDHTNGNEEMERLTGRKALGFGSVDDETGIRIEHEAELPLGKLVVRVIHTPGHTDDSVCYLCGDALFTGDTLFVGKIGGTDFGRQAVTQFHSLRERLLSLDDEIRVFPGHDVGESPESTIGRERSTNPFLMRESYDDFLYLKKNWQQYKLAHGIL